MKHYKFLISETWSGEYQIRAKNANTARAQMEKIIKKNDFPSEAMQETSGYSIDDWMETCSDGNPIEKDGLCTEHKLKK